MRGFKTKDFDILDPTLDLKRSYFIEASAGTGKTFTIENSVIRLVEQGISIDQILVVTFTRAATLELKMRIRRKLEEKKLQNQLLAFEDAKIFTIHGFCFHTLKEHALETGFALSQNEESASLSTFKRIFRDFFRSGLKEDEVHTKQLEKVFKAHQNDFDKLLKELSQTPSAKGRNYSAICSDIDKEVSTLNLHSQTLFQELLGFAPRFGKMCDRQKKLKADNVQGLLNFTRIFEGDRDHLLDLPILKMVPENLLKGFSYPDLLHALNQKLIPLLAEISDLEKIKNALRALFQEFLEHVCESQDLFFYDELLKRMQKCIRDPSFAEEVRSGYKAVFIDEFQDTDPIQWEIFSTLFLNHLPLYLVGDPKQSIYRFRGADLYIYMQAKERMGEEAHTTLTKNFRSDAQLIHAYNTLFSRTPELIKLPKTNQVLPLLPIVPALEETNEGEVIFCQTEEESAYFSFVIEEIERLHQEEHLPYSACALLVKDHYQAKRFCLQCPLPFMTKKSETLLDSEAFTILEDLLLAVYHSRQREYIAKVLGGPLFNVPLENLKIALMEKMELFYRLHQLLKSQGILSFFKALCEEVSFAEERLYLDLLQLVELIAQNASGFEEYLPHLQKIRQSDPEAEGLRRRAMSDADVIQVMTTHVSKGLEFGVIFPAAVMSVIDLKDEEEISEKMRQLYVALTRAKKRAYLPVVDKENTPIHLFLSQALKGQSLEAFVKEHPHFSLVICDNKKRTFLKKKTEPKAVKKEPQKSLCFPNSAIYSYTTLSEKKAFEKEEICLKDHELPVGPETGIVLHRIFEKMDFGLTEADMDIYLMSQIKRTSLEGYFESVKNLVHDARFFPLPAASGEFCLAEVSSRKMIREMEFLYPSDHPSGYIKGFIDLFFEHQGRYYLIDWKSNFLESYSFEKLQEAMDLFDYGLQAKLYKSAAQKYLKLFKKEDSLSEIFYVFLRGLDFEKKTGVYCYAT